MGIARIRVLIVDDEERFARLSANALAREGFLPKVVNSLRTMESELPGFAPDIVIVSAFGLGARKLGAVEQIHRMSPTCPLVVTSPLASVDDYIHSYALGAQRLVHKSVDMFPLVEAVRGVVRECVKTALQ
jgi:DNA-binding response OmpR family regulator